MCRLHNTGEVELHSLLRHVAAELRAHEDALKLLEHEVGEDQLVAPLFRSGNDPRRLA
jgi:hypothetical protein